MPSQKKYLIANWKSNKSVSDVESWITNWRKIAWFDTPDLEIVIAPAFAHLHQLKELGSDLAFSVATQDLSPFPAGSYTGAVSTQNLIGLDVKYAIVGHSERRSYFYETHQDVARKVTQALEADITPIVCVDDEYIVEQAKALGTDQLKKCIVAYEELTAIGTGNNQSARKVKEIVSQIKNSFGDVPVVYGGSVKPENARNYVEICSGVLVGGASLDPQSFYGIVKSFH